MTPAWSMNVAQTSNAKKGPAKEYNAYKDYSDMELDTQVIASTMAHFSMTQIEGKIINFKKYSQNYIKLVLKCELKHANLKVN